MSAAAKVPVAVLGATGAVGQRFVQLLGGHPSFTLASVVAGDARAGKRYGEAARWLLDTPLPAHAADLPVETLAQLRSRGGVAVAFSALPSGVAGPVETELARRGLAVFTNARDHRMDPDVPLLFPEINPGHLELVRRQPGPGFIVANGNCTSIVLELPLFALHRAFGVASVDVTSLQGLSGAGYPGVSALDVVDNVLPFIGGEEEKVESEPLKTLGRLTPHGVAPAPIAIHATATRVAVREGHLESIHLRLRRPATLEEAQSVLRDFTGPPEVRRLPSAPPHPILLRGEADRPQPRRDREAAGGMAVSVGRLRLSPDGLHLRLVALGSNTVRGAAGQSVLNAELALAAGYLGPQASLAAGQAAGGPA